MDIFNNIFDKKVNLGFDLGTYDSSMAIMNNDKQLKSLLPMNNPNIRSGVPSLFYYSSNVKEPLLCDQVRTGNYEFNDPGHVVSSIKMKLNHPPFVLDDRTFTSEDIIVSIIEYNKKIAEAALEFDGLYESSNNVVIGIPAAFGTEEKAAIRSAAKKAGLSVLRLLPEPIAAGVYYSLYHGNVETPIVVLDIGAGTTDIALIQKNKVITGNDYPYKVLGSNGIKIAGDYFDEAMMNLIIDKFRSDPNNEINIDKITDKNNFLYLKLKNEARKAKESLSVSEIYNGLFFDPSCGGAPFTVTAQEFEQVAKPLMNQIIEVVKKILVDNSLLHDNYLKIICVGGSSYMPIVKKSLQELCPQLNESDIFLNDPDFAITYGCALYANDPSIIESKINFSYAIDVYDNDILKLDVCLPAGVSLPHTFKATYYTRNENQTAVSFGFFELKGYYKGLVDYDIGDSVQLRFTYQYGRTVEKGTPVELEISVDKDGILSAYAYEKDHPEREKATTTFNVFNNGEYR